MEHRVRVVLNEHEAKILDEIRDYSPDVSDHRRILGIIRFGIGELKRNPQAIRAFLENRSGRPVTR